MTNPEISPAKRKGSKKPGPVPDLSAEKNKKGRYTKDEACLVGGEKKTVNIHTGKTVLCNTLDDMMIIPASWARENAMKAVQAWDEMTRKRQRHLHPVHEIWDEAINLGKSRTREEFKEKFDHLLAQTFHKNTHRQNYGKSRGKLAELCIVLWREECLLWPRNPWVFNLVQLPVENEVWGEQQEVVRDCFNAFKSESSHNDRARFRLFVDFLLSKSPPSGVLEITPDGERYQGNKASKTPYSRVVSGILFLQKEARPQGKHYSLSDFGYGYDKLKIRSDKTFAWAAERDARMEPWRALCEEFLKGKTKSHQDALTAMNMWLDYLLENPGLPRNPVEFFARDAQAGRPEFDPKENGRSGKRLSIIHDFLEFSLLKHCSEEDDYGNPKALPRFKNPMPRPVRKGEWKHETHREPMPTRFVSLCLDILTANDFEWPKKFGAGIKSSDWFKRRNPTTGQVEDVWSPVRTLFLILKLMLPARTYQLRMVDSGEGDTFVFESDGSGWEKNGGPHAPKSKSVVQKGVFRRFRRKDGTEGSLLYFNTNKTADVDVAADKRGFVMPWEHKRALELLTKLRDWQIENNSVKSPAAWADLVEMHPKKHEDELSRMGRSFFLFRDPAGKNPDQPITDSRIRSMWVSLIVELEKRLEQSGERLPDGSPIKLVTTTRRSSESPVGVLFDLHTLRVTMITALYEEGVPPEVIMKIVGHASVLMTLYYTKISSQSVSDSLNEAFLRRAQNEQSNWIGFLQAKSREQIQSLAAHGHPSGLDAFKAASGSSIVVMDHGFCPMGARRCSDGLAETTPDGFTRFVPVPGGASNCARCRFFISGPAFLVGLEAHFNDLSYRLKGKSKSYQEAQEEFDRMDSERADALDAGEPFSKLREMRVAESALERSTAEADELALGLQASWRLIEQSLEIAKTVGADGSCSLVVQGGADSLQAVLEEAPEIEQLQRICESSRLFRGLQVDSEKANLSRMRMFDKMLAKNGLSPVFSIIDDDEKARLAADQMGKFLFSRLSRGEVGDLFEGRATLRALGIAGQTISAMEEFGFPAPALKWSGEARLPEARPGSTQKPKRLSKASNT